MNKILIKYNGREVLAFLLAYFNMVEDELVSIKGLFGKTKNVFTPIKRRYCLVFIPWKHKEKEAVILSIRDVLTIDKLELMGADVVSVEEYVSPFTEEFPYRAEYKITDFVGYEFVYNYRGFIADIRNQCFEKTLTILYQIHPELLKECTHALVE